jgi:hypothetical protein
VAEAEPLDDVAVPSRVVLQISAGTASINCISCRSLRRTTSSACI